MKKDQKLIDLFKDNEHKLHEYPSADAWRRLEERLDARRRRKRIAYYRPIAMAAALTLLVGMVALYSWVSHTLQRESAEAHAHFVLLEDLAPSEGSNVYAQNLALREQYDGANLEEGNSEKRFHVNQPRQTRLETSNVHAIESPSETELVAETKPAVREEPLVAEYSRKSKKEAIAEPAETMAMDAPDLKITADDKLAGAEAIPAPPVTSYEKAARTAPAAMSDPAEKPFQWLVGTWQTENTDPIVLEEWTYLQGQQFETVIYTVQDGQKKILEKQKHKLQTQGPNQAVFFLSQPQAGTVQYEIQGDTLIRKENEEVVRRMRRVQ